MFFSHSQILPFFVDIKWLAFKKNETSNLTSEPKCDTIYYTESPVADQENVNDGLKSEFSELP